MVIANTRDLEMKAKRIVMWAVAEKRHDASNARIME